MSELNKPTLEDVRHAFTVVYSEFYSEWESLLMFDSWVDEFTAEYFKAGYDFANSPDSFKGRRRS